ncbi:hypothetical protein C8R47DRAFT_1245318 [Mycena vitilis]|nr:hypothetical protein C8R47DRAFT_1245318 [Mycena vitilis]
MECIPRTNSVFVALLFRLPAEIVSLVLLIATGLDDLDYLPAARRRRTLCLVCKSWAASLYATPQAWSRLDIVFGSDTTLDTLRACLVNSRQTRIEVAVEVRINHDDYNSMDIVGTQNFIHTAFSLIGPHFHRIGTFRIICPEPLAAELALSYLARMECSNLNSMYIVLNLAPDNDVARNRQPFVSRLPRLTHLYTAKCLPPSTLLFCGLTVTDLRLVFVIEQDVMWLDFRAALSSFPRLKSLRLGGVVCSDYPRESDRITLPILTHLDFTLFMPEMGVVLLHIATPSLHSLHLTLRDARGVRWLMKECDQMGQAQKVNLLITPLFSEDLVLTIFRALVAVRDLDLSRCSYYVQERLVSVLAAYTIKLEGLALVRLGSWISELDVEEILQGAQFAADCRVQFPGDTNM